MTTVLYLLPESDRDQCGKALASAGYRAIEADTTTDAMKILDDEPDIDVLLLDLDLPGAPILHALTQMTQRPRKAVGLHS